MNENNCLFCNEAIDLNLAQYFINRNYYGYEYNCECGAPTLEVAKFRGKDNKLLDSVYSFINLDKKKSR